MTLNKGFSFREAPEPGAGVGRSLVAPVALIV